MCQYLVVLNENVETENGFVSHFQIIINCDQSWMHDIYILVAHVFITLLQFCSYLVSERLMVALVVTFEDSGYLPRLGHVLRYHSGRNLHLLS